MWRQSRSFDADVFIAERPRLVMYPPRDVIQLFDCYNSTLSDIIDKMAPMRPRKTKARLTAPWFDAEFRVAKVEVRDDRNHAGVWRRLSSSTFEIVAFTFHFHKQSDLFQKKIAGH